MHVAESVFLNIVSLSLHSVSGPLSRYVSAKASPEEL